jgi:tRNA threonylcarbamoyladenosine biosynthesis protein TsaE
MCTVWINPRRWQLWGSTRIFDRQAVVLIEWGERFPQLLPEHRIEIQLRTMEDSREIEILESAAPIL